MMTAPMTTLGPQNLGSTEWVWGLATPMAALRKSDERSAGRHDASITPFNGLGITRAAAR
jgi:hypothetical protein